MIKQNRIYKGGSDNIPKPSSVDKKNRGFISRFFAGIGNVMKRISWGSLILFVLTFIYLSGIGMYAHANGVFLIDESFYTKEAYLKLISGDFGSQHTSVSSYVADQYLTQVAFSVYFAMGISSMALSWFTFQLIVAAATGSKIVLHASKIVSLLILNFLVITPMFETTTASGLTYKKPIITYLGESIIGSVFGEGDKMSETDFGEEKEIPAVRLAPPQAYIDIFTEVTELVLKTEFVAGEEYNINVVKDNGQYKINFRIGGKEILLSMSTNNDLNAQAYNIGIDLAEKEKEYVIAFFNDVVLNAIRTKEALIGVDTREQSSTSIISTAKNTFNYESNYPMVYTEYCDNLFYNVDKEMNEAQLSEFVRISSMCASRTHITEHYKNDFYDYREVFEETTELKKGKAALFGNQALQMTTDDIIRNSVKTCKSGGYLACTHTVALSAFEDRVRNLKNGIMTSFIRMILPLTQDLSSAEGLQNTLKLTTTNKLSNNFMDLSSGEVIATIKFTTQAAEMVEGEVTDLLNLVDISKLDTSMFSSDNVAKTLIGRDTADVWGRLATCSLFPSQIKNGYRCLRPSIELTNAAIGFGQMAIRAYVLKQTIDSGVSNKNADFGFAKKMMGDKSNLITGSVLAYATDRPFIESEYYAADTINNLMIANLILSFADPSGVASSFIANFLGMIAKVFGILALSILTFVYIIPMTYFRHMFDSLKTMLTLGTIAPVAITVDAINGDMTNTPKKIIQESVLFLTFVMVAVQGLNYMDIVLINVMSGLMTDDLLAYKSLDHFTSVYPVLVLGFILFAFICLKSIKVEMDEVRKLRAE